MIYRALIDSQYGNYQYKVRIPAIDNKTYNATVCATPGVNSVLRNGDAVYVTFEKDTNDKAVILGTLYNDKNAKQKANINGSTMEVSVKTILPHDTFIGDVTDKQISYLKNLDYDINSRFIKVKDEYDTLNEGVKLIQDTGCGKASELLSTLSGFISVSVSDLEHTFGGILL